MKIKNIIHRIKGERLTTKWLVMGCDPIAYHGWDDSIHETEAEAKAEAARLEAKYEDLGIEYFTFSVQVWTR